MGKINIAIIDQHPIIRLGLSGYLNDDGRFTVTQSVKDFRSFVELIENKENKPDVVIIDMIEANKNKYQIGKKLEELLPNCKVLCLIDLECETELKSHSTFANGYISKKDDIFSIFETIECVLKK